MIGSKLLLDSNIIIYLAKKELEPELFIGNSDIVCVSDISVMETLGYSFSAENEKQGIEDLLEILLRLPIDDFVVQKVISIRKSIRIKLPDAIIAATCLVHSCKLVTRNSADFSGIPELKLIDPFRID